MSFGNELILCKVSHISNNMKLLNYRLTLDTQNIVIYEQERSSVKAWGRLNPQRVNFYAWIN